MNVQPLSSVVKCLEILDVMAEQPGAVRISELGRLVGASRATTYQRLLTLAISGWVERMPDGSYRLSTRACRVAATALNQAGFGARAQPVLDRLATDFGEAISLVMLQQDDLLIVQRAEGQGVLRADLKVGAQLSYVDSASGPIWLAFGPEELAQRLKKRGTKIPARKQIELVREKRVAIGGGGRTLPGISALAVPIMGASGQCRASLSISSPEARFAPSEYTRRMTDAAQLLSGILG